MGLKIIMNCEYFSEYYMVGLLFWNKFFIKKQNKVKQQLNQQQQKIYQEM